MALLDVNPFVVDYLNFITMKSTKVRVLKSLLANFSKPKRSKKTFQRLFYLRNEFLAKSAKEYKIRLTIHIN